jgi:signal transduction histidine kinase
MINVEPVDVEGGRLFILFMRDISAEKEKAMIERIFFHDVLNSAASLDSLVSLLHPDGEDDDPDGLVRLFRSRVSDIVEQINYHKQLLQAEKGQILLNPEPVNIGEELEDLIADERQRIGLNGYGITINLSVSGGIIETDRVLLRRILINMIKNAREASSSGDTITVKQCIEGGSIQVDVHNPAVMSREVKSQVFQRSFSTKGAGRGLGSWSMKLLSSRYLGGDITFQSREGEGTTFTLQLPVRMGSEPIR